MQIGVTIILALSVLLSGCAVSPEVERKEVEAVKPCCKVMSEMPIDDLLVTSLMIQLNFKSPTFDFPTGRSYFSAFALPEHAGKRKLEIRTFAVLPTNKDGMGAHTYFFPAVTFLNSNREAIGTAYGETLKGEIYGAGGSASLVTTVPIPIDARYGIIHTNPSKYGELHTDYVLTRGFTMMVSGVILSAPGGQIAPLRAVFASAGKLMISMVD